MQSENLTDLRQGEARRRYGDACGTAHGLELIGERWALLVLRELMLGARRFSELKADLPGISANVLSQRLSDLEGRGLIVRRTLPPPASVQVYEATEWGLEAESVLQALGRWAARSPGHDPALPISAVSVLLSFRTMFVPARATGLEASIGFEFGTAAYVARLSGQQLTVERGATAGCDAIMRCEPAELAAIVYGDLPIDTVEVRGDRSLVERFVNLFELPPKAA